MRRTTIWTLTLAALLFLPLTLAAQTSTVSQLTGIVKDASGAPVPGAAVQITNVNTNATRTVQTTINGSYTITNLDVGTYALRVTKTGFQTYVQTGITVDVNSNFTINPTLQLGTVTQTVQVQASSAMVETQNTSVGQLVDQQQVVNLPLNGRQETDLVALSGAAVDSPTGGLAHNLDYPNSTTFSIAGAQSNATFYYLDGAPNMDMRTNVGLPLPFPDAVQQFKVETSALPANYGSYPGGAVNAVTKSGTNQFHGDLFEFLRNGYMDARNFFAPTADSLKRNQFGGDLGGPVIPNKLFFFGGFQGTIEHTAPITRVAHVPTQQVLNGNFQTLLGPACRSNPVTLDSSVATNNILNSGVENSVGMNFMKLLPVSSDPCGLFRYGIPQHSSEYQYVGRVDWQRTPTDALFARVFLSKYSLPTYSDKSNLLSTSVVGLADQITSFALGDTHTLGASSVNSLRVSFTRTAVQRLDASGIPTWTDLGSNVTSPVKNYMGQVFVRGGYFTYSAIPGYDFENTYALSDNLSMILGQHTINMGFDWMHTQLNALGPYQMNPRMIFDGTATGDSLADIMTGNVDTVQQGNGQLGRDGQNEPSIYFQDFWKISPKFQLNLGLRWDPFLPQHSKYGLAGDFSRAAFDAGTVSQVFVNAPAGLTFPGDPGFNDKSNFEPEWMNFAPRIGIVYDPGGEGKESIRAGYGVFYGSTYLWQTMHVVLNPPYGNTITLPSPSGGLSDPWQSYPGGNPFPTPPPSKNVTFPTFATFAFVPFHAHATYVQQWNLSVQKQLGTSWMVSASYMGNKTTHLWLGRQINPAVYGPGATTRNTNTRRVLYLANPTEGQYLGSMSMVDDGANANYNGLLLTLQHRFSNNFSALTNYTWSHCLSYGSVSQDIGNSYQDPNNRKSDYGNCDSDHRQVFNLSLVAHGPQFSSPNWAERLLGNWQGSAIFTAHSGGWLTVTDGRDISLTGVGADRPNTVANPKLSNPTINEWFNTSAFVYQPAGTYGNTGRNTVQGPGNWNLNMALWRVFPIKEGMNIVLRGEAFNALNHTEFQNPVTSRSSGSFGQIQSANDPRIMQVALKFTF